MALEGSARSSGKLDLMRAMSPTDVIRCRRVLWRSALGLLGAWLALAPARALADEAAPPPAKPALAPEPPATPKPRPKAAAPARPPLPVTLTVVASSPDPPWLLRIENTGESPIRIPADVRLLTLELTPPRKATTTKCSAPAALRPSKFPASRELYLKPGDAYEEPFDPRLICFGDAIDLLREGTSVKPRFGFGGPGAKGPFAAQGTDRPESFAPVREIVGAVVTLPAVPPPPPPGGAPQASPGSAARSAYAAPAAPPEAAAPRSTASAAPGSKPIVKDSTQSETPTDRQAPALDIYVSRHSDAGAARDIVMTIRAVNEGRRELLTVIRSRMLAFHVEALGPDNRPVSTVECRGQDAPHAIPVEAVRDVDPGQTVRVPILIAEVCPPSTFSRPGLYRVTARLDPTVGGEGAKKNPHVGEALARQSALIRVATARDPFYADKPMSHAESQAAAAAAAEDRRKEPLKKLKPAEAR